MREILQNNTSDSLSASCLSTDTTISVTTGSKFPATGQFRILVESEIMLVTARSTNTLTVVRGQEGTTAAAHGSGLAVTMILTQGAMQRYGRDNDFAFDSSRPPFRLLDASGNVLTKSSFTVVNASTSTITDDSSGAITIRKATQGSAEDFTMLTRPMPTSKSVIACLRWCITPAPNNVGFPSCGIGFRESGTGKCSVFLVLAKSFYPAIQVYNIPGPTTIGTVAALASPFLVCFPVWFKLVDDGTTNLSFYLSHDGENWTKWYQAARTSYMTGGPDQVFFTGNNYGNSVEDLSTLIAWQE